MKDVVKTVLIALAITFAITQYNLWYCTVSIENRLENTVWIEHELTREMINNLQDTVISRSDQELELLLINTEKLNHVLDKLEFKD